MNVLHFPIRRSLGGMSSAKAGGGAAEVRAESEVRSVSCGERHSEWERVRSELEGEIDSVTERGGEDCPLLLGLYCRLGELLLTVAQGVSDQPSSFREAEEQFLLALDIAELHGNTTARVSLLGKLSEVAESRGESELAGERQRQAEKLCTFLHELEEIPLEGRLESDHPALPKVLHEGVLSSVERLIAGAVMESHHGSEDGDFGMNVLAVRAISRRLLEQLRDAGLDARWIDDLFVFETAEQLQELPHVQLSREQARECTYRAISEAAPFLSLGLKEKSIRRLSTAG
ncbi:hypothetical protein MRY87_00070 [bacterium]|nr:hypothetical protein [bacterium]